jgi:RNA polymerase sigma-70 factor (ECF subfamily)
MKLRKRKQNQTISIEDIAPAIRQYCLDCDAMVSSRSDSLSMNRELRDIIQNAINRLPEQYRAVFVLRDVDGMSNQEVGEILGLSVPAVKSRLHRSRLMLRKKLQRHYTEYVLGNVSTQNFSDVAAA